MNKLLKNYIKKSGLKLKFIADKLDITYPGLKNKLDSKSEFTVSEALRLKNMLNINDEDFKEIFSDDLQSV